MKQAPPAEIDVIARLRDIADGGSRSDRKLAIAILADPDFAVAAAIDRLAGRSGVSEATVTRFCRALGCSGLRDFKVSLAKAVARAGRYIRLSGFEQAAHLRAPRVIAASAHGAIRRCQRRSRSCPTARSSHGSRAMSTSMTSIR